MISNKTLQTLEFDKILDRLQDHASFSAGKETVLALRPAADLATAQTWQSQTSEARRLLEMRPATHLGGAHDVRGAIRRAEVGSILTPEELLDIGGTLGAAARFRSAVLKDDLELPWLRIQAGRMAENQPLVEALARTFSDRGEILDSASPALRRIRSDINTAQGRLMERLNSMVSSAENRTALQEPIVTVRNGRYVIPVRQDSKNKVPGIVHDQSASGQTLFVEPLAVTEMNNRLKELQLAEQREIERILQALSEQVARHAPELTRTVIALRDVDVAFAKAKYAGALRAYEPRLNAEGRLSLISARHPLLQGDVVPISIWLGGDFRVLVITGPNTGGKTVALKTVGLLSLMAQAGMHVPAAPESELAVFPKVFADIGDEQNIEQSLSTFSSHMRNIIGMMPEIDAESLVLLDELGAGTDPQEGAALARSLLESLLESGARAVVTTHYSDLKTFAHEREGVENASVEFDVETLSPTYRLIIGLPGRSQALAIAKRLGMPERVLARARQHVSAGAVRIEKLLAQIQEERQEIGRLFERARDLHDDARKIRDRVRSELRDIQAERERILAEAREEGASAVRQLRARLRQIEEEAQGTASRREQRELRARVEEAQSVAAEALGSAPGIAGPVEPALQPIRPGAVVAVGSLGQQGTVLSVADGEAEVQVGQFKMRVALDDLQVLSKKERAPERTVEFRPAREAPPREIDVRGWRADDALRELDQYLHDNYMHGQNTVRIVHGKGTGALRKAIREQLSEHPLVKSIQAEKPELGGEGVTVVNLAT
ncbi:MAG: endonuclease MutS2 [Chloroflexi bacterium]|nr:endonuclease MutS2 [Chloroflexota bacterium]